MHPAVFEALNSNNNNIWFPVSETKQISPPLMFAVFLLLSKWPRILMQLTLFIIFMAVWVNVIQNLVSQIPLHANSVNPMDVIRDVHCTLTRWYTQM